IFAPDGGSPNYLRRAAAVVIESLEVVEYDVDWIADATVALVGARPTEFLSYQSNSAVTACCVVDDGSRVAVKVYPPGYESRSVIAAARRVQAHFANQAFPVPRALAG